MTEKRFTLDEYGNIEDHHEQIILNGGEDCYDMLDLLNELNNEKQRLYNDNIRVKQLITEAYRNERTQIGQNVLKQLIEQI